MRSIKAVLFAALLLQTATSVAAEPTRRITHCTHQRWTEEGEAPAPIVAMAQDRDGYLWLATGMGLFGFDGIVFERIAASTWAASPLSAWMATTSQLWPLSRATRACAWSGEAKWVKATLAPSMASRSTMALSNSFSPLPNPSGEAYPPT